MLDEILRNLWNGRWKRSTRVDSGVLIQNAMSDNHDFLTASIIKLWGILRSCLSRHLLSAAYTSNIVYGGNSTQCDCTVLQKTATRDFTFHIVLLVRQYGMRAGKDEFFQYAYRHIIKNG
jgi:hypothetical protein